jgi:hypothetical protein
MPYGEIAYCKWAEGVLAACSQQFRVFILWVELEFPPTEDEANAIRNGDVDSRLVLGYTDMEEDDVEMSSPSPYTMLRSYQDLIHYKNVPQNGSIYGADGFNFWAEAEGIIENRRSDKSRVRCFTVLTLS